MIGIVAFFAIGLTGCGDSASTPQPAPDASTGDASTGDVSTSDASTGDAGTSFVGGEASFRANLPQRQVVSTDTSDAGEDAADAYVLEEGSVDTCAKFFECLQDCPPEQVSCLQPCHDAMTPRAADLARRFISCVQQNSCRNPDCMMRECGSEMQACFSQPEPA